MSNTKTQKVAIKFNKGLIPLSKIPENIRKKWDRWNFDKAYYKEIIIRKKERIADKELKRCLMEI